MIMLAPAGIAERLWILSIQAFFIGMLIFPTTFQAPRGTVLVALASIAIMSAFTRWRVHRDILLLWGGTMVVGAGGIVLGVVNDAPGALRVATVYLVWPTLYLLFIGLAHDLTVIRKLESALLVGISVATGMAIIVLAAGLLGVGDAVYPYLFFQGAAFGHYEGFTEFRTFNLATVMYGFPFVTGYLLSHWDELRAWRLFRLWLLFVAMVIAGVGSGRRMFWLLLLIAPFLALFFLQLSALRMRAVPLIGFGFRAAITAVLGLSCVVTALRLEIMALAQQFVSAFMGEEASSGARFEQAVALWRAFEVAPALGNGLGAVVEVVRSSESPWNYELWYLSLLMNVGVLGFGVYVFAIGWIMMKGVALAKRDDQFAALFVPMASAMSSFVIMSASNPYLGKFDYIWVIFLPVALINAYLTRRGEND